jgi:hypothetical protein
MLLLSPRVAAEAQSDFFIDFQIALKGLLHKLFDPWFFSSINPT